MLKLSKLKVLTALLSIFAFASAWPASASAAATNIVLVLDGIRGESTSEAYKGGIEISSMSFGASTPTSEAGKAGKVSFSEIQLMKVVDSASLPLLKSLISSKPISSGTLYFIRDTDRTSTPYLKILMKNILVTSDQYSGASGGDKLSESFSLRASEISFEYTIANKDGSLGSKQRLDINIDKGTAQ